jgi:exodeoxyribonuclease V gamma subunit
VLRLSGELALAGFGQAQQDMLLQQRDELLERFEDIAKDWPLDLAVQSTRLTLGEHTLSAEWANGQHVWKTNAKQSAWLQVEMRPGSVLEGKEKAKHPRAQTLTTLWLNHLVACASGTPTTSVQIGLNGAVQLDALSPSDALAELQNLVTLYQEAWHKPLPVARKTACAFVMAMPANQDEGQSAIEVALLAAQQVFDGNRNLTGEYESSTTLQRVFHGFADVQNEVQRRPLKRPTHDAKAHPSSPSARRTHPAAVRATSDRSQCRHRQNLDAGCFVCAPSVGPPAQ